MVSFDLGLFARKQISKEELAMKANSATIVFVLDLIGALALAAGGVVAKHYIPATVVEA